MKTDEKIQAAVLGKPLNRVDGRAKVTGQAKYAAEHLPEGVKYGVLLQSTIARGTMEAIDDSQALKLPGVIAVVTHKNSGNNKAGKSGMFDNELNLLQSNKIFHDRQNIGVVVADTYEIACQAAALVKVTYKEEKPIVNVHDPSSSPPEYAPADNAGLGIKTDTSRGDAQKNWQGAPVKFHHTYSTPREVHCPMEPHATTAMWEGDKLTVWDATQGVSGAQSRLAAIFHIPPENVRVICPYTGGGFGCKGSVWSNTPLTALAAKIAKVPVCLNMKRTQTFGPVGFRPYTSQQIRMGADKSGKLTAIIHNARMEVSEFDEFVENCAIVTRFLYSCPNVQTTHRLVKQSIGKPTWMRAPGETPGTFALESAMDELAAATDIDPIQVRLINYSEKDEENNLPYSNKNLRRCYELGAQKIGWDKRNPKPRSVHDDSGLLVGMGMATATYPVWAFPSHARAVIAQNGHATVQSGSQDIGTGTYTIMTQIAADELALPMDKITFELGDTRLPPAGVSGGSTSATCVGTAVKDACDKLVHKMIALAVADGKSPLHGMKPADIEAHNGGLQSKTDRTKSDRYVEILKRSGKTELEARSVENLNPEAGKYSMHSFGAHFCEVKVDPDFGSVRISRWVAVIDGGKIFNMKTAVSQIYGGIIMGVGMALMEESLMDPRYGRTMNADFAEYHVPVHADIPDLHVEFVQIPDYKANPLGGHGIGEIGITGAAAAVANAVYNATGVRVRDLPISLDKLMG